MILVLSICWVILSSALTKIFCHLAQNSRLMDQPNERSLHVTPTVRGGGLIFIGLSLISLPFLAHYYDTVFDVPIIIFVASVFLLAAISFIDDLYQLSARLRFLVQCIVAILVAFFMRPEQLDFILFYIGNPYLSSCFIFFAVIWAINHFNFMDGLDGFCASQALFLFAAYALLFGYQNAEMYQDFCLILIFSLIGFLIFNFPPAKLFMGDIGSASLGLITFCIALIAQQKYQIPFLYWFILNGLFLFDATITLLRRVMNKEKWFAAHRKHAYQRLKQFGVESRLILLGQALINGFILVLILLFQYKHLILSVLIFILLGILISVYYWVERLFPMYQNLKS